MKTKRKPATVANILTKILLKPECKTNTNLWQYARQRNDGLRKRGVSFRLACQWTSEPHSKDSTNVHYWIMYIVANDTEGSWSNYKLGGH